MRGLFWILFLLIALSAGLSLLRAVTNGLLPPKSTKRSRFVKDPICGMYIAEETAIQAQAGGVFFCSEECRRKYEL